MSEETESTVLPKYYSGGPHNLGDPDDKSLRKVEIEILVPGVMRRIAQTEHCVAQMNAFTKCCQKAHLLMWVKCRAENEAMTNCLTGFFTDSAFRQRCTDIYLEERSEYRRTGLTKKQRKFIQERDEARKRGEEFNPA